MRKTSPRWILYSTLVLLYLLHNDFWFWHNPKLVLGLPIGLLYHIGFCVTALVLMKLLVSWAWPSHLETESETKTE